MNAAEILKKKCLSYETEKQKIQELKNLCFNFFSSISWIEYSVSPISLELGYFYLILDKGNEKVEVAYYESKQGYSCWKFTLLNADFVYQNMTLENAFCVFIEELKNKNLKIYF